MDVNQISVDTGRFFNMKKIHWKYTVTQFLLELRSSTSYCNSFGSEDCISRTDTITLGQFQFHCV